MNAFRAPSSPITDSSYRIRPAQVEDIPLVASLDGIDGGRREGQAGDDDVSRLDRWRDLFKRFGGGRARHSFLVAMSGDRCVGFALGDVRASEYSSPPCGHVFVLYVDPSFRRSGIGTALFEAMCVRFRGDGATAVRMMVPREGGADSPMAFCRRQGMKTGPFFQFEKGIAR